MADYTDLRGRFVYKRPVYWAELDTLAENDAHLKNDDWEDGCKTLFFDASPIGWTKVTDAGLMGRTLRLVSGSGGVTGGGAQLIENAITLAHTHGMTAAANHTHTQPHRHNWDTGADVQGGLPGHASSCYTVLWGAFLIQAKRGTTPHDAASPWTESTDPTTGAGGAHDHGTTGSKLTDITLAYVDVILCSKDTTAGYTDLTAYFSYGLDIDTVPFDQFADNDAHAKVRLMPQGAVLYFFQETAPVGWLKTNWMNDRALRLVPVMGGTSGGSSAISSTISLAHSSHTVTPVAAHAHTVPNHVHVISDEGEALTDVSFTIQNYFGIDGSGDIKRLDGSVVSAACVRSQTATDGEGSTANDDRGATHTHGTASELSNITLAYANAIIAMKQAYNDGYTDMTSFFSDDHLLAWQDLETLAQNDENIHSQQMPAASITFFYQAAAPLNWTKLTSHNDKILRIISGAGGGTVGGVTGISSVFSLAHTHVISSSSHRHYINSHTHNILTTDVVNAGVLEAYYAYLYEYAGSFAVMVDTAPYINKPRMKKTFSSLYASSYQYGSYDSNNHGGATGSALADTTLAYADVIACQKN